MRLCGIADGRLLGNRVLSDGGDVADPGSALSSFWDTQHNRHVRLLHERHYNGVHRWLDPRHRYRT